MKTVTNGFKEEIAKLGREIDFRFFLHTNDKLITEDGKFLMTQANQHLVVEQFDDTEVDEIINAEDIYSVSIVTRGNLLSTMMKELDFEINKDLRIGDIIECEFGLKVEGNYEYINYGKYMIYSKEFNEDTKTFSYIAYDRMLLTMQEASQDFLEDLEGRTLANCINVICGKVGLSFNATQQQLTDYPNLSKTINEGTFTDMQITYRDILDMICQALGLSMIVKDKKIVLKNHNDIEETLSGGNKLYIGNAKERNAVSYSVDGVSEQDGTPTPSSPQDIKNIPSVVNLLNISASNYTHSTNYSPDTSVIQFNENGYTQDATSMPVGGVGDWFYAPLIPGKTYILSWKSDIAFANVRLFKKDKSTVIFTSNSKFGSTSFTAEEDGCYFRTWTNGGTKITLNYAMLEEGTVAHEYVPYGAYARVKITGKNLCDGELESGDLNSSNGNNETNNNRVRTTNFIEVNPSTTYHIGANVSLARIIQYDSNKNFIRYNSSSNNPLTTTGTTKYIRFSLLTTDITTKIQVEENTESTPYEPYKEKEVLIDMGIYESGVLTGHYELCSNKDKTVKDRLLVDTNGNCSITKYIGKINSYNGETVGNDYMSTTGELTTGATVYYVLDTSQTITLPNTQIPLFGGINHITLVDDLETDTSVVYNSSDLAVEEIDETYLKDTNVSFGDKYGPINSVVLSRSEDNDNIYRRDEESIAENGVHEFKIKDNLIMLYDDREDYIDEIFEQLNGLEYYINDFSSTGITYLDWLDFYNVNIGDKTYKCLMLNDEINIEQGLEENIYTEEPEETVTPYKTSSKTDKEVSFIVDKQNGKISVKVSKGDIINEINLDESGASINANKVNIQASDVLNILAGNSINLTSKDITINSTNFNVDKNGNITANNVTLNSGTFKGNVNTSQNCYVGDDLYVGQNQSSDYAYRKAIIFSNKTNVRRSVIGSSEALSLTGPFVNLQAEEGISGSYMVGNNNYSGFTVSNSRFQINCNQQNTYIEGDSNGIYFSHQPIWSSDRRLKQEIKNIDTSWIDELKVKEFEYIKSPNKKQIGLIAQDYEDKDYAKYFLNKNNDGYYGIAYGNITNALIQYCQEMKKEINSLKEEIKQLKEDK